MTLYNSDNHRSIPGSKKKHLNSLLWFEPKGSGRFERDEKLLNQTIRKYRKAHLDRLGGKYGSPGLCLYYVDILSSFRRIKEHALNVAEIVAAGR